MNVALVYDCHTDGAPISVRGVKPGVWLWLCRACGRNAMEGSQADAVTTGTTHLYFSPFWRCGAAKAATHRHEHHCTNQHKEESAA